MDRWRNRVAVVTGASAGIGSAIALDLVKAGMIVVAVARRLNRLHDLKKQISDDNQSKNLHVYQCDVSDENGVKALFNWCDKELGGVDVLVNNAGILRQSELLASDNTRDMMDTLNINVMGVLYCTREAYQIMRKNGVNDGHFIVINSLCGHHTINFGLDVPSFNMYPPSKHAVTSMVETYRQDFIRHKTKMRITSISPGAVDTEIFPADVNKIVRSEMVMLSPEDVSSAVLFAIAAPPNVQVHELTIKPVGELF